VESVEIILIAKDKKTCKEGKKTNKSVEEGMIFIIGPKR